MNLFTQIMHKSVREGQFKLHYRCEKSLITQLSFVDDLIAFMGGGTETTEVLSKNMFLRDAQDWRLM